MNDAQTMPPDRGEPPPPDTSGPPPPSADNVPPPPGADNVPPPSPPSPFAPLGRELRALRRSRSDRVVAGVLGGLGRHLGIDPLVLRILTVVLALFGGTGILLYAAAWLLLPVDDEDASVAEQALGRRESGSPRTATVALAVGLAVVIFATFWAVVGASWDGGVLLVLIACGLVVLLRRDRDRGVDAASVPAPVDDGHHGTAGFPDYPGYPGYPGSAAAPTDADNGETRWWTEGPDWDTATGEPGHEPSVAPPRPRPRRSRSALGLMTMFAAAATVGIVGVNDIIWADVPPATYVACALAVVGLGLLLGTWWGRSRGLIVLGIALALGLAPAVAFDRLDLQNTTDVALRPATLAELPTGTQDYGAGRVHYDLSALDFAGADPQRLSVDMGAGELVVIVPSDVDVEVDAEVGVGQLSATAFGESSGGFGPDLHVTDLGDDGPGGGLLVLDLDLGVGNLEVRRAAS